MIGIFYIATGIYKNYFKEFVNTIHYVCPNKIKKLIVISDGLTEYDGMYINDANIIVEDFIAYPYPFININKLQIVQHYAQKHKIDTIIYFDSETFFIEKSKSFYDDLINLSNEKFISLTLFKDQNFSYKIYGMNYYTYFGENNRFDDFSFFYKSGNYDTINNDYNWIRTSFFMCSLNVLEKINNIIIDLITYNQRVMGCKLNYSDEFYVNYLNQYYPELFHADYYDSEGKDVCFFRQKTYILEEKNKYKFGNLNFNFRTYLFNIDDDKLITKFFIEHRNEFLMISCNSHTINDRIFFNTIYLNDEWFTGEKNIILERSFYSDIFIQSFESWNIIDNSKMVICFINSINEYSNNFDYDKFYYDDYDYIKGYSFDDIKNIKFKDIDMCCFSKRYINAYFNNDLTFVPKIYEK